MDFELRPARPADVEAIMQVMADAMANLKHPEWFVPDDAVYMAEHISGPKGFCLVAEEKASGALAAYFTVKLAGTAPDALGWQLGMSEEELNATAQMDSCCVAPPYQGNGLEGKLLLMAEDILRGSRYCHLLATVHPDNAASLYTGLHRGYTIAADHVICYGDKVRDILRKDLNKEENKVEQIWKDMYAAAKQVLHPREVSKLVEAGGVAAAVEAASGKIYVGVCVDTACTLGVCAERNAIFNMLTNGETGLKRVIAINSKGEAIPPCGACRELMTQLMPEEYKGIEIMMNYAQNRIVTLGKLTPEWWI